MAEPNLDQELIEQDELLNAFQVILKNQNTPSRTITRKKPTSLPLRTSLNSKVYKHSNICDYIKVKKPESNRNSSRETKVNKNSATSSIPYIDKLDNKEISDLKIDQKLKEDNLKSDNLTVNDDDSSPSDYLTPATANYFPLGTHQPDMNKTTDISPQFDMDMSNNDSCHTGSLRNDFEDTVVENNSTTTSGIDFTDSACEIIKDDLFGSRQGESTSKEEKERLNEEIAVQSSSLSSETGSWEPVFPAKNNIEIKQICSIFIRNEQIYSQTCNSTVVKQNVSKSSAFFIDAKSLIDDTEVYLSYGSNVQALSLNKNMKKSISKESNDSCDTSNEDSLELEVNNIQKQSDSSETVSTQFHIDVVSSRTPENSIIQVASSLPSHSTDSPHRKQRYDECMPIVSGGASIDDFAPQLVHQPICQSLPTSLDPNINNSHHKEKFINSWIVNYDNLDNRQNASSSSSNEGIQKSLETKKPLGFYVDFSKVESEDESTREASSCPKSDKKIFSMYVDISDNKSLKEMPSSLSSSMRVRSETPKDTIKKRFVSNQSLSDNEKSPKSSLDNKELKKFNESPRNTPKKIVYKRSDSPLSITRQISENSKIPTAVVNKERIPEKIINETPKVDIKSNQKTLPNDAIKNVNPKASPPDKTNQQVQANDSDKQSTENKEDKQEVGSVEKQLRNPSIQKSVKASAVNRHSWNLSSCSLEGGMQRILYQTRKSASLSHCNLKDIPKGNISKKDSNYSLSDISLGDQSYSRSEDSKTTDQNNGNEQCKAQRKRRSDAKINETFDKSSTCSDKLTLTQDSTPTVTEQEELTYHPEENETNSSEPTNAQKFVKLSDLDKLPSVEDNDEPLPLMTNSLPIPSLRNSKIMFHSLHVENLDKLARLFPEIKKELSRSSPESMSLSYNSDKSSISRASRGDNAESSSHTFTSDLEYVFLHEIGADINIVVDHNRIIRVNKAILAARCSYFAAILATKDITEIIIDNFEYSVVHFALLHIYSGIRIVPATINIFLLAALADKWNLLDLKDIVSKILFTEVCHSLHRPCSSCTSNALRCLTISDNYNMDVLFKSILVWTGKHFDKIWLTEDFSKLPQHLMERCVRWVTSSIRVANLTDILHKCECIQTSVVEIPRTINCFLDHVINECTDYISTNLALLLGDQSTLRLLYPPYKNGNLLEVVLFKGAQKSSPEKLCVAIKHTKNLMALDCPEDSPFKKVLCRLLPHLEGTVIIKVHSIERIVDTSGWKELDLSTQERIKYFFRLIKKPTVIMVPPICKISNQSSSYEFDRTIYSSRPVSRLKESSHIPILARDIDYTNLTRSSSRPLGHIQPHKHFPQELKKPAPKTIVKLKAGQTSSGRQSPGDKLFNKSRSSSTTNEHKINTDTVTKVSKFNTQNRSHPNLSNKHIASVKLQNSAIEKPVKSLPGSVKQSPPVTLSKISPDTSLSSKTSTSTKCSQQNRFHNANKVKNVIKTTTVIKNKPLNQVKKLSQPTKQTTSNKTTALNKTVCQAKKISTVPANKVNNVTSTKTTFKQIAAKNKSTPSTSEGSSKTDNKKSKSHEGDKCATNKKQDNTSNYVENGDLGSDIPVMERSGTFLKDEPSVLDKMNHSNY